MAELLLMVHIPLGNVNVPILITRSRREGWCLTTHETVDEGTKHASDSAQRSSVAFLYGLFVDCGRRPTPSAHDGEAATLWLSADRSCT